MTTETYTKPSEFLATLDAHGIYDARALDDCTFDTSMVPKYTHEQTLRAIDARGLGGTLSDELRNAMLIYGYDTADALAQHYAGSTGWAVGRGTRFRQAVEILKGAGF